MMICLWHIYILLDLFLWALLAYCTALPLWVLTQIDVLLMAHLHNFGFILLNIICFLHYSAIDDMIYTLFDFSDQYILHTSGLTHRCSRRLLAFCNLYASMLYVHVTICIMLFIFATSLNLFCFQKFIYNYILHLFLLF